LIPQRDWAGYDLSPGLEGPPSRETVRIMAQTSLGSRDLPGYRKVAGGCSGQEGNVAGSSGSYSVTSRVVVFLTALLHMPWGI